MEYVLYHYGVKGQKWGVRRYQNKDGSLTNAGKERYYTNDEQKRLYEASKKHVVSSSRFGYSKDVIEGVEDISEAGNYLKKQSGVITDNFNKYTAACEKDLASLKTNQDFIAKCKKRLTEELGGPDMVDDEELLDWAADDAVYDYMHDYWSADTKKANTAFTDSVNQYYSNVKSIVDDIVGEYGNQPVSTHTTTTKKPGMFGKTETITTTVGYKEVVETTLHRLGDSQWVRYLNNHTEAAYIDSEEIPKVAAAVKSAWKKDRTEEKKLVKELRDTYDKSDPDYDEAMALLKELEDDLD